MLNWIDSTSILSDMASSHWFTVMSIRTPCEISSTNTLTCFTDAGPLYFECSIRNVLFPVALQNAFSPALSLRTGNLALRLAALPG
jgi:hypothetical protein